MLWFNTAFRSAGGEKEDLRVKVRQVKRLQSPMSDNPDELIDELRNLLLTFLLSELLSIRGEMKPLSTFFLPLLSQL